MVGVWIDDVAGIAAAKQSMCTSPPESNLINALVGGEASTFYSAVFRFPDVCNADQDCFVHFCLSSGYPKFKLLSLETM
jgi:hypothetical protein